MKKTRKFFSTMMALALALMTSIPMQAKAAEVAQPETVSLVENGYYQQVGKEGTFERYDDEGNLISSTNVEDALFKVNATLTGGWGQASIDDSHTEGTFANAILDTKGYFRCDFTTKAGVCGKMTVKVKYLAYESYVAKQAAQQEDKGGEASKASMDNHSTDNDNNQEEWNPIPSQPDSEFKPAPEPPTLIEPQPTTKPEPPTLIEPQPTTKPEPPTPIPPQPDPEPDPEPVPPTPVERPGNTGWTDQPSDGASSEVSRPGIGGWTD